MTAHEFTPAWAAGFFDGEGTVFIDTGGSLRVAVSQNILWPLELLQDNFGGNIYEDRGAHVWRVAGEDARCFLASVFQWLTVKRRQASLALAAYGQPIAYRLRARSLISRHNLRHRKRRRPQWSSRKKANQD